MSHAFVREARQTTGEGFLRHGLRYRREARGPPLTLHSHPALPGGQQYGSRAIDHPRAGRWLSQPLSRALVPVVLAGPAPSAVRYQVERVRGHQGQGSHKRPASAASTAECSGWMTSPMRRLGSTLTTSGECGRSSREDRQNEAKLPNRCLQLSPRSAAPRCVTGRRTACGVAAVTVTATASGAPSASVLAAPVAVAAETRFVRPPHDDSGQSAQQSEVVA